MIQQSYDFNADALYIRVSEGRVARTQQIDAGTLVDLDGAGAMLGIEVIHPGRAWPLEEILTEYDVPRDVQEELRTYFSSRPGGRGSYSDEHQSDISVSEPVLADV